MANEENLKPVRTKEEARERGHNGGIKSGEVRRQRKAFRESMNTLLSMPIASTRDYNKVANMGIDPEDIDNSQLIVVGLFNRAKTGDVFAIQKLLEMIGEVGGKNAMPTEPVQIIDDIPKPTRKRKPKENSENGKTD